MPTRPLAAPRNWHAIMNQRRQKIIVSIKLVHERQGNVILSNSPRTSLQLSLIDATEPPLLPRPLHAK